MQCPPSGCRAGCVCVQGLARDAVLESLQYALRKARTERDAEVAEADKLFNALQQNQAAAQARDVTSDVM